MPRWKRWIFNTSPIWIFFSMSGYWIYFAARMYCTVNAQRLDHKIYWLSWIFVIVELTVAIPTMLHLFMTMFIFKPRQRPQLRLTGNDVPAVDVFVTCCKEDTDLVLDTVRGACDIDYPMDRFRVIVLDDGRDTDLEDECEKLRETMWPNLYYRSREKIPGKPHHFKAGNLNYGFEEVRHMPGGAAQFAAALDADMIPERHWLRALMPHMLVEERMALACPPQLFYNTPKEDPLSQSLDFFVHVLEGIKDALGVAWCTGSGYVLRREALEEIGWFPLGSLAEDVATSTLMLGKGWKTAFVHEPLQFGTVPEDFGGHLKQRTRWAIGTVDTAIKLKFCLYGEGIARMTFFQRLSGFIYAILAVFNIFTIVSLLSLPIVLSTGKPLVAYANDNQLRWLIRLCFAALLSNRITELIISLPAGYSVGQNSTRAHFWMSPYIALTLLRTFILPKWLGGQTQAFKPTGSLGSDLNERDKVLRAGVWTRVRVIIFNYMAWYHIVYVYFCLSAATLSTSKCAFENYNWNDRLRCLLTHAFWPPVSWIMVCSAFWVPINYAIDPPTVPPRDELLDRDPKTLVAHPKESSKKTAFGRKRNWYEMEYTVMTLFTIFIFVAAFIWI
ncbi:nucleotide-diphospho-sugar transferase [Microthyrium microscopicum]|uniref:Nucleotide-diphospho-sugar transferase n=1 Tax=Microthyrium microscopicum TaxID=703497 RepID=A0A6A6UIC8_9PEZI|nr:nucleotide-diphospho-sugar transferase [Microthyrium microscopicum]